MIKRIFIAGATARTNWRLGEREPMKRPMVMAWRTERQFKPMKMKKGPVDGLKLHILRQSIAYEIFVKINDGEDGEDEPVD
jgi:hypothetical protein